MARMSVDLPAPERPDDDDHLAVGDLERQAPQGMDAPGVRDGGVLEADRGHRSHERRGASPTGPLLRGR